MIVIFAMIFALVALRLYSVLGRRGGHEQKLSTPADETKLAPPISGRNMANPTGDALPERDSVVAPVAQNGLRALIAADRSFDAGQFIGGAKGAFGMILEAFWKGDRETLRQLCNADVAGAFEQAIDEREAAGHKLENRLVRIERAEIADVELDGRIAKIAVRFEADIAAITRDTDGQIIAGSLTDAEVSQEQWTFSRDLSSRDPNWTLVDTADA
jgi:predicted lipid-binding transport protein (Tim44 family)